MAATEILKYNVRAPVDDFVVEVARRLGFQRTGQDLQQVILEVIEREPLRHSPRISRGRVCHARVELIA